MSSFENANFFFHNCESSKGWDFCKEFVANNANFIAQCEPLAEVTDVKTYVDWMEGLGTTTMPGCRYEIHASAFDESTQTALFFATFIGTHSGEGGPVPPTNKTTHSHYVYTLKMNGEGKVERVTKIWNSSWALRELGWM
jgi:hypothetical protein